MLETRLLYDHAVVELMKDTPILYKDEMVLAMIQKRKTETRRLVLPQPEPLHGAWFWKSPRLKHIGYTAGYIHTDEHSMIRIVERCSPYGGQGDRLWVKEVARLIEEPENDQIQYRADGSFRAVPSDIASDTHPEYERWIDWSSLHPKSWRSSLFLPRWASRLNLDVLNVVVERLQSITEEEAKAEGCEKGTEVLIAYPPRRRGDEATSTNYRAGYKKLWDKINGKSKPKKKAYPWETDPWVYRVKFSV